MKLMIFALLMAVMPAWAQPVTAESWLLTDESGRVIASQNSDQVRSIASITKLMTTMVVLDAGQDLDQRIGRHSRRELIQLAMIRSDNTAAQKLCESYPGGRMACVAAMNARARELGMTRTHFVDPTGLGVMNVSTGQDLVRLVQAASAYAVIRTDSQQPWTRVGREIIHNTNRLVNADFWVSKTGYIRAAGGCVVMMLDTAVGRRIVILLGSRTTRTRITEAQAVATITAGG